MSKLLPVFWRGSKVRRQRHVAAPKSLLLNIIIGDHEANSSCHPIILDLILVLSFLTSAIAGA